MPKIDARFVEKKTPIFTTIVDDYQSINYHVKKHILEMRKQNPQGIESNVRAWRSHWFTHKITKVFDPLVKIMVSAVDYVADAYYNEPDAKFETFNFWVMDYDDGDETMEHNHFPSEFSCVYYVDCEEGCSPLIIEGETIQPENGLLVIFPAHLDHKVPANKGRRMAASGNFIKKAIDIYQPPPSGQLPEERFKSKGFKKLRDDTYGEKKDFYTRQKGGRYD